MKTVVTVSNLKMGSTSYRQVVILTSLYDADRDDIGLASISFDSSGSFSFKVQLRYVSHTLPMWCEIYNTLDVGRQWAGSIYNKMIDPLVEQQAFSLEQHTRVNDVPDDSFRKNMKGKGWNAVLEIVECFLMSIDPEYRLFPIK